MANTSTMDRIKLILIFLLLAGVTQADETIFQPVIYGTGSSLTVNSGVVVDFMAGSSVDFTGATVTGLATGGTGTVTNFSAGDLAPLFTTTEATTNTTPALSFSLTNAAANSWFGNATGLSAAPSYNTSALPVALLPAIPTSKGGVPTGGAILTVLVKSSAADYDYAWTSTGTGIATLTSGAINVIPDNHVSWDNAAANALKWDGGASSLVPATGRASLSLDNVTNDAQTKAAIVPNTVPTDGQLLIGNTAGSAYIKRTISGSGATFALTTGGQLQISAISNASLSGNTTGWDTAASQTRQWDGGATGLVAATGRASLALDNVSNNAQTQAAIMPNTAPASGQLPIGNAGGTAYVPRTISGSGATATLGATGILTINNIADASLNNAQTYSSIVPNTVPSAAQVLIGNPGGTAYVPRTISGSGATATLGATGILTINNITDASLVNSQTYSAVMPNTAPAIGQIPIGNAGGTAYVPRTMSAGGGASVSISALGQIAFTSIPNTWLLNPAITIAGTSVALGGSIALGPQRVVILTSTTSATYTVPATARALWVEAIGAGGGGGGATGTATPTCVAAGGGAGGGFAGWYIAAPAATYTYQCGLGGVAGVAANGTGGAGASTTFGTLTALGGNGGTSGTAKAVGVGGQGGVGVTGSGGTYVLGSGDGMAGIIITGGNVGMSGQGGSAPQGGGNTQGKIVAGVGLTGANYGGGGSGALSISATGVAGGAGANGIIKVTEFY